MSVFTDILPRKVRQVFYAVIALAGIILGSLGAAYATIGHTPGWLLPVAAGYAYFAGAFGLTAGGNVNPPNPPAVTAPAQPTTLVLPPSA